MGPCIRNAVELVQIGSVGYRAGMSDHIAHLAICDDTFRLALLHRGLHPAFRPWLGQHRAAAQMGAVTRTADRWTVEILEAARDHPDDPLAPAKVAFVLGALTHRAADRLTKPITNCWPGHPDTGGENSEANESKIMQDLLVFQEVYGGGGGADADVFPPGVLAVPTTEAAAKAEEYFRVLLRRALIAMHTLAPDTDNIQAWLTAFLSRLQTFPKDLRQYARLAAEWDPQKVHRYLIEKNFYCRDDELIQLARAVQRGSTVTAAQLEVALSRVGSAHSRYARALAKALDYLLAASELYAGRISAEQARQRFDIGVPELSLQQ
jgi:hypothetical protein